MVRQQLPEKWCIRVTEENNIVLGKWRSAGTLSKNLNGYCLSSYYNCIGYYASCKHNDYEEITFEEFEIHILKTKPLNSVIEVW